MEHRNTDVSLVRQQVRHPSPSAPVAFMNTTESEIFAANGWLKTDLLHPMALKAVQRAVCWAADTRWESVRTPHLFMGVLSVGDRHVGEWCRMIGTGADSLLMQFATLFTHDRDAKPPLVRLNREFISENAIGVLRSAHKRAQRSQRTIQIIDLLVALFSPAGGIVAGCFADVGYPPERLAAMAVAAEERNPAPESR